MTNPSPHPEFSADLAALLTQSRPVDRAAEDRLKEANKRWWKKPSERSEYHKAMFIATIREAMEKQRINQSQLAEKWGKTRQYLSKVLNQDNRVNFTIETMVELTLLLGLPFRIVTELESVESNSSAVSTTSKRDL